MKKCPFCAEEIQDEAKVCKHCGRDLVAGASQVQLVEPKKKTGCVAIGCATVLALLFFGWLASMFSSPPPARRAASAAAPTTPGWQRDLEIVTSTWEKSGFGAIAVWQVTIRNKSKTVAYKDLVYTTRYDAPSGTQVSRGRGKILDVVRPRQSRTFKVNDGFVDSQATKAGMTLVFAEEAPVK